MIKRYSMCGKAMQDPSGARPDSCYCSWQWLMCCLHTPATAPRWTSRCGGPLPSPPVCKQWRHCETSRGPETISPWSFLQMFVQVTLRGVRVLWAHSSGKGNSDVQEGAHVSLSPLGRGQATSGLNTTLLGSVWFCL